MRYEQDEVGVSLFLERRFDLKELLGGLALPGLILLGFGLVATVVGLEWAGPALLFAGIGLCISVPLTLEDPPYDLCTYLRLDHLGVRANGLRLSANARIEELERGLRVHDEGDGTAQGGSIYLPADDASERAELRGLLERSLRLGDARRIPQEARILLDVPPEARARAALQSQG